MQTTLEETGAHSVKLTVEVPPEEFGKDLDRTYKKIAGQVKIPGFRKGKAPRPIIDAQVGKESVLEEFVNDHLYTYYMEAVREHELAPITDPDINVDDVDEAKPLSFTAEMEVRPRLELTKEDYEGLKVQRPSAEVTDEDITEQLDRLRDRFAELESMDRPAATGDYVAIDIKATSGGAEIEEATRGDALYELGSGMFTPKLDTELEGKKKGDIIGFDDELPEGLGEFGGQEVSFTVLIKEVKGKKLPPADDEFAKLASEFDTLDELKADLRTKLEEVKVKETDQAVRDKALELLVDDVTVDLPETLIEHETQHRIDGAGQRAARMGLTLEQMLEIQGWDEERLREDAKEHAIRAIKADLVLESISRNEEFEVTAEELGKEIASLAQLTQQDPQKLAARLNQTGQINEIAGDSIRSKALDFVVDHADITPEEAA